jgi:hypothetical protein
MNLLDACHINEGFVKILLEAGADPEVIDKVKNTIYREREGKDGEVYMYILKLIWKSTGCEVV